jgi:hypothetical protein
MTDTCAATTTTLNPEAGEVPHRCGLVADHKRTTHVCFYCGHGWPA